MTQLSLSMGIVGPPRAQRAVFLDAVKTYNLLKERGKRTTLNLILKEVWGQETDPQDEGFYTSWDRAETVVRWLNAVGLVRIYESKAVGFEVEIPKQAA